MLVITSSVGMVNWVHSNTSNLWEILSLSFMSPILNTGLEDWLFISTTSSNNTDHSSRLTINGLSDTRWQLDSSLKAIFGVSDNGNKRTRSSGEFTIVSFSEFDIRNKSTFRNITDWKNVTNLKGSFFSAEDSLSAEHTFNSEI